MAKKYSLKFWIIFWTISAILLAGFYIALEIKNKGLSSVTDNLPIGGQYKAAGAFVDYFLRDDKERTFLVLFQNNMEIRPGGGFIGSFGILKVKNGKIQDLQIHDTGNFDGRIPDTIEPPYPMKEALHIPSWKFRDSNYSPDYLTNVAKAKEFYYMGQGQEQFDGVIAITSNVLLSFLKVTGPVEIPGYPGTYGDENAVITLEYQVEKAYYEQGIAKGERKSVMNDLGKVILEKVMSLNATEKFKLIGIITEDLQRKDIQLNFNDATLQSWVEKENWGGIIDQNWKQNYLMTSDANLGAYKSDYYVKRSIDYTVNLSQEKPTAKLAITYTHTATQKDWMTKDYLTYLRVYVPKDSWLTAEKNFGNTQYGSELGKDYFGAIVTVPLGTTKTVEIEYTLPALTPEDVSSNRGEPKDIAENYNLKIQKQPGINDVPVVLHVIGKDGKKKDYSYIMNSDIILDK